MPGRDDDADGGGGGGDDRDRGPPRRRVFDSLGGGRAGPGDGPRVVHLAADDPLVASTLRSMIRRGGGTLAPASSSSSPRRGVLSSGLDWLARATDDSGGDRGDDDDDVAGIGRGGGGRERGGDGGGARGDVESGLGELQRAWERLRADGGGADGERATPSSGGGDDGVGEDGGAPTDAAADLTNSAAFRSGAFVANVSFFTHRPLSTFDRFPFQLTGEHTRRPHSDALARAHRPGPPPPPPRALRVARQGDLRLRVLLRRPDALRRVPTRARGEDEARGRRRRRHSWRYSWRRRGRVSRGRGGGADRRVALALDAAADDVPDGRVLGARVFVHAAERRRRRQPRGVGLRAMGHGARRIRSFVAPCIHLSARRYLLPSSHQSLEKDSIRRRALRALYSHHPRVRSIPRSF